MAIGDNYNDLEMLEFAGLAVVMGNASEELEAERLEGDRPAMRKTAWPRPWKRFWGWLSAANWVRIGMLL